VKYLKGIKGCSSKKPTRPTAKLKCLYANVHIKGNKQEELEATMLLERCDLTATAETWWDESMTGVWLSMTTGCSERTGKEGEAEALPSISRNGLLPPAPGGFVLSDSHPAGGLQPPRHLLEK